MEIPDRSNSWLVWHEELARLIARFRDLWNTGCAPDRHSDSPAAPTVDLADEWPGVS